jgi:hypothetical protein
MVNPILVATGKQSELFFLNYRTKVLRAKVVMIKVVLR